MRKAVQNPVLLVIAGIMLLQTAWILTMPPFRGADEFDHAYRAAAVAGGQWVAGGAAEDGRGLLVIVPGSLVEAAHAQCESLDYTGPDNCSPVEHLAGGKVTVASSAAPYPPAFYWLVGTVALPFDGAGALYAMRIATALLSLVFIGLAAWSVAKLPGRWPMASLMLAVTPVFVYSTTVAAPNGVELGAGLALWGSLLALVHGQDRRSETRLLIVAISAAVVLGSLRVLGPVFILMIVATVAAIDWGAVRQVILRHRPMVLTGSVLVGLAVLGQVLWMFDSVAGAVGADETDNPRTFNPVNLMVWPLQTIAAFPLRGNAGSPIVYPVVVILVSALVIAAWRTGVARVRWVMAAALVATLLFPYVFTLATLSSIGNIWQGRYGLPYGVGFVLIAGYLLGRRDTKPASWGVVLPAAGLMGAAVAACLIKVRNDELFDRPASIADPAWHAPLPILLALIVAAAMACFAVALSSRHDEHA